MESTRMESGRSGDLVLPQGHYVLLQDGSSGQVEVVTGPHKMSPGELDKTVVYNRDTREFELTKDNKGAISVCPTANEGQYIVLTNPTKEDGGKKHPSPRSKESLNDLDIGRKIHIQGPDTFALYPGQVADVIDGHQIKSNEYLLIRVYNEKEARENLKTAVIKSAEGEGKKNVITERDLTTGNLLVIKGTDVSFYIPPTGIEVTNDDGNYVRNAVTLERLEYCILLDQNGDKRYIQGPSVVFPKPTETFVENKKKKVFRAIELNDNMGIYIKVIADYQDGKDKGIAGEERFITGKEQKIYFPRAEHAVIKYGDETIHYATAVPAGEGRYILNKNSGDVELFKGPKMLLPDPRTEVIVKRVLDDRTVKLWFPGNTEALEYNQGLKYSQDESEEEYLEDYSARNFMGRTKQTLLASAAAGSMTEELDRKTNYTKPRSIKLDTKYEGAVLLNIWPNYAVQIVNKKGDRRVVEGPKAVMMEYDETLEVLELSTGKPKTDHDLMKTVYLQTKNNVVSDLITVETRDLIDVTVRLSYKVDFESDSKSWFNVSDYVKLLSQHMRSMIRNKTKKHTVEEFNETAADIIRDIVLGESKGEGKGRDGRPFSENGMKIYDVEVLDLTIGDTSIDQLLKNNQHTIVKQNLESKQMKKDLAFHKDVEENKRAKLVEEELTKKDEHKNAKEVLVRANELTTEREQNELDEQETLNKIKDEKISRKKKEEEFQFEFEKRRSELFTEETQKQLEAIQPGLIEALISSNDVKLSEILARNIKEQKSGSGFAELFTSNGEGGFEGLLKTVKGTNLENRVKRVIMDYQKMREERVKDKK